MGAVFHVISGTILTLVVHGTLWAGAWGAAVAWPGPIALGDRLLVAFSIALFQSVGITLVAAAFHLLNPVVVGGSSVALSTALVLLGRRALRAGEHGNGRFPRLLDIGSSLLHAFKEFLVSDPLTPVAAVLGLAFFLLLFLHAAPRPPMGYDPLNYHLTIAATAIQTHTFPIVFFPPYFDLYSWFPSNGAVFPIWTMLWMGCDLWIAFVNLPFLAALALVLYLLCRDLGLGRAPATALTSAFLTVPMSAMLATEAYAEFPMWSMLFVAVRFALLSAQSDSRVFPLVAGLCGLIVGTKTVGMLYAILVFLVHVFVTFRPTTHFFARIMRRSAWVFIGVLLFGSYFYIRNFLESGNPFYPLPIHVAGFEIFTGQGDLDRRLSTTTIAAHLDFLWRSGKLLRAVLGEVFTPNSSWGLGPTGFAAILLGVPFGWKALAGRGQRPASALFVAGFAVLVAWFFLPYGGKFLFFNVRFAFPGAVLLGLVAASGLSVLLPSHPALLVGSLLLLQTTTFFFENVPVSTMTGVTVVLLTAIGGLAVLARRLVEDRGVEIEGFRMPASRPRRALLLLGISGLALYAVADWHDARERGRIASYREATEPYQLQVAEYADCLAAVERHVPRGRLAVALEPHRRGFLFPLFGSHLQREVLYVHNGPEDSRVHSDYPYGNPRLHPDEVSWIRHLADAMPDALLVFVDPADHEIPIESRWASDRPDLFHLEYRSDRCELHRIDKHGLVGYR